MESTVETQNEAPASPSIREAWRHCQHVWSASTRADAWHSFKQMLEATPIWGYAVFFVALVIVLTNLWIVAIPAAVLGIMGALFLTVKHAILSALREFDSQDR